MPRRGGDHDQRHVRIAILPVSEEITAALMNVLIESHQLEVGLDVSVLTQRLKINSTSEQCNRTPGDSGRSFSPVHVQQSLYHLQEVVREATAAKGTVVGCEQSVVDQDDVKHHEVLWPDVERILVEL